MLQEIKQVIFSRRFLGAACLMFVCLSGYAACDWIFVYDFDIAYRPSSLQLTLGGIFFGGTMLMIPLCAALPAGILQAEEFIDTRQRNFVELFWEQEARYVWRFLHMHFFGTCLQRPAIQASMSIWRFPLLRIVFTRPGRTCATACRFICGWLEASSFAVVSGV